MPLSRAHPRDQRREPLPAAAVQLDEVSCDQTRASHRPSLRAVQLAAFAPTAESGIVAGPGGAPRSSTAAPERRGLRGPVITDGLAGPPFPGVLPWTALFMHVSGQADHDPACAGLRSGRAGRRRRPGHAGGTGLRVWRLSAAVETGWDKARRGVGQRCLPGRAVATVTRTEALPSVACCAVTVTWPVLVGMDRMNAPPTPP